MPIRLGVVMDPIGSIHYEKDSTLAMLWEAQARGYEIYYFELADLFLQDNIPYGKARRLTVAKDPNVWATLLPAQVLPLADLTLILMRKDPPVNEAFIYTTYILEQAERLGVLVANRPQALRDANEKLFAILFPQCIPPTVVTMCLEELYAFWQKQSDIVCKPLNSMGGTDVFRLQAHDKSANDIFTRLTRAGTVHIVAQRYIPDIVKGDKRIILINGEPIPFALARIPQGKDWRGNLAVGAKGVVQPLTERDQWIAAEIGSTLRARGLYFVGIDVIGDYLTEINVTSPTGIRQIDAETGLNISAQLLDALTSAL